MPVSTVGAVPSAVYWLSDLGFIIYEAMMQQGHVVELRDAAITARGREFLASFSTAAAAKTPLARAA